MEDPLAEALRVVADPNAVCSRGEAFTVSLDGAERSHFGGWIATAWGMPR